MVRAIAIAAALILAAGIAQAEPQASEPATPPAYEDRLIEGGALAPLRSEEEEVPYNAEGWARSWSVEGFGSRIESGDTTRNESGFVLHGRIDTPEYGAVSIDGTLRTRPNGGIATVWQRGLPFDNGWRVNNGLGMLNTPGIDLTREQFRFYLPTFPMLGVETEWLQRGNLQLQAAVGEPGQFDGLRLEGFSRLGGHILTAGAQWRPDREWQAGVQMIGANDVRSGLDTSDPNATTDSRAWYGALAWNSADSRVQFNALDSEANAGRHNLGLWIDAETNLGRYRHNYGAFRFEPHLAWGYSPINSDLQGGYYRVSYASQQWTWSGGVDSVSSVTGISAGSLYGTGNVRYQVDHSLGVGGGASVRHASNEAAEVYGFVDKVSLLGTTRVQLDLVSDVGAQHSQQLTVDHAWPTQAGLRLSTTLSIGLEKTPETRTRRASISAFGGIDLTNYLTVEGNLRWSEDRDTMRTIGRYANVGLVWRISPQWSLLATYYDNRSQVDPVFAGIAPILPVAPVAVVPRDRAIFISVRYEGRAGTPTAPLGGMPGTGAGALSGTIFYDANDDGRRGADESGAANVTVVLDGRFATRTDSEGRFTFPFVAAGPHVISVIPDNLALSYIVRGERREVMVRTRETTTIDIAASRTR